ncbi:hypothetical protein [uncultured Mediterranean phage uvMED]|nr:hypothetical protein [uncultured Mediterranean phage uvMED]BAQ90035.1 hypothetical protein [uncultured Mediterranean phage uvMED]
MSLLDYFEQGAQLRAREAQAIAEGTQALRPTPAQTAYMAASMAPGFATADAQGAAGRMPAGNETFQQGLLAPGVSMRENIAERNLFDATMQGLGLLGDAAYAVPVAGPFIGSVLKGGSALGKVSKAGRAGNVPTDVPRVLFEGDSAPQALAEGTKRTFQTTGKYRGAPAGTTSPQKLAAIQRRLREYAERGAEYRMWYEDTNEFVRRQTENRPGRIDQYGATAAITSQGTSVPANATMAMKGYNQAISGNPVATGRFPATQSPAIEAVFSGESPPLGPKREPFFQALVQDPSRLRQTNDIRQARAFGYQNADGTTFDGGLSDAQHRFMDEETDKLVQFARENKLGGVDDWNRDRVQAAIWIAQKAEEEGTTIAEAGRMFQDFTPQALVRTEAAPSTGLNHLAGLQKDPQMLAQFSAAQDELMRTPGGLDYITAQSGAMSDPMYTGAGMYEGASNPGVGIPVSVGKSDVEGAALNPVTGERLTAQTIDPASRQVVEATAAMQGLLRAQDTVGYTMLTDAPKAAARNALDVNLGRTINREELLELEQRVNASLGEGNLILLHSENGVQIVTPTDDALVKLSAGTPQGKTPAWQKELGKIVEDVLPVKSKKYQLNTGRLVGDDTQWSYRPSQYLGPIEAVGPEMRGLLDQGAAKIAPELEKLDAALVKDIPGAGDRNVIVSRTRAALERGGTAEVRRLVEQGVLPALVGAVLLGGLTLPAATDRPQSGLL